MKQLLFMSLFCSLLSACSSKRTADIDFNPTTNFQQYSSYQYSPETEVSVDSNPVMIHRIKSAIDSIIESKGLTKQKFIDKNSAYITIKVSFTEHEKEHNSSFNIGIGTSKIRGNSSIGVNTNIPINGNEKIITKIVIDMSNENQTIWHASDSYEAINNLTSEQKNQKVNTMINELLANFPPKKIK